MREREQPFMTKYLGEDDRAPDGSISLRSSVNRGSMAQAMLPPGRVSKAVCYRTIEEIWFFVEGIGQVWRNQGEREQVVDVFPAPPLSIPTGTHF